MNPYMVQEDIGLLETLLKMFPNQSRSKVKEYLVKKEVYVNSVNVTQFDYPLRSGDIVEIKKYNKNALPFEIIYEDAEIIVINKPAGLLTMANEKERVKTAYHLVYEYVRLQRKNNRIFIVHRLDQDTSGLLIFAKKENIKNLLQDKWNEIMKTRGYVALVEGNLDKKHGRIHSWLKETKTYLVYSSNIKGDGQEAITDYEVIEENDNNSLLQIYLSTGRKNQIRVHMQSIGHSIVGDAKYGAATNPIKRLGLHCNILEFTHPISKKQYSFKTGVPPQFKLR